ncbi:hypothetical protein X975_02962, partial [Stegodyphus mimosarum]
MCRTGSDVSFTNSLFLYQRTVVKLRGFPSIASQVRVTAECSPPSETMPDDILIRTT